MEVKKTLLVFFSARYKYYIFLLTKICLQYYNEIVNDINIQSFKNLGKECASMNNNKEYTLKGILESRTSKKGNEFECLVIKFGNYEKLVFLTPAEKELLKANVR